MNRQIKFRVWDIEDKRYINNSESGLGDISGGILDFENGENGFLYQQFTELFDQNGKEIYEGDIIKMGEPRYVDGHYVDNNIGVVCRMGNLWALHPIETLGDHHGGVIYFPFFDIPPVIGNIFENPELLKEVD